MRLDPTTAAGSDSPIGAALALAGERDPARDAEHPLLDLSQAAPAYPPAPEVVEQVVATTQDPAILGYAPVPGLPPLRRAIADELSRDYAGTVTPDDVTVTAGCNQAFAVVADALAGPGDEMIMPLPYYFNHQMWLTMRGVRPVYLEPDEQLVPRAADAEALITPRTRAIVLVTPGNPNGVTVPPSEIVAFAGLARRHGIALVVDETYRSFRDAADEPAHPLFADPDWRDTVVSLHSYSKDLAIPGYRAGSVVAGADLTRQVLKLLDCVAICAPRVGQEAALAGLTRAGTWRAERVAEVARRRAWLGAALADRPGGFEVVALGAFFAWVRHPFEGTPTLDVVRELVLGHDTLTIPGTAFLPDDRRMLRLSVGKVDEAAAATLATRLAAAGSRAGAAS
ncbi:Aspartate aminotransferase [Pseudonocardia sp. Ae168_Ps1]|uniref:aminotransferase n=1 Tax=unclassified Pseudonocardia TaxID=2619320 RepID=UPI00094AD1FC|nr:MULTISPECIES: aminotransferase [unclassified Pseudonocardia]OLL76226.1 Aspartate aminotransferase [Pseudonocardia sp. Ae150A_Ps1]OLL82225.1 Aspartate aminotransferase [Pseudonocardia sp. Ae168_Ps1]OLL83659.1 Aspartate aminotransferase [Pseudonocardia sp. Ae263_Ps1]OLL90300.1 Aspartate aminotransferase [Pseudonocardia sp. Ae356_Ps1]